MEFVVGIISLSYELYSLLWSCFRSRGSDTIVYGKWWFDLHVECCGSCMISTIGVGARRFLVVRRIFAQILPNLFEKFWAALPANFSLKDHEDFFWDVLQKRSLCVFLQILGAILWNQTRLGAIFPGISEILPRFSRILPGFSINQNFEVRLLHYWLAQNFRCSSTRIWSHLQWRLGVCSAAMSNQMVYWAKKYVTILTRAAHWITYFDLSKPNLAKAKVLKSFES